MTQLLLGQTSQGPSLHIDVSFDRSLRCPANTALQRAVKFRLPGIHLETQRELGAEDLALTLRQEGAAWLFEVTRADGSLAVRRGLAAMSCPQLADTSALILERYLADIRFGREVNVAPLSALPIPDVSPPPADAGIAVSPVVEKVPEPLFNNVSLWLGAGGSIQIPFELNPTFLIEVGARLLKRVHVSVLFLGSPGTGHPLSLEEPRGVLLTQTFATWATVSWCTAGDGLSFCGGALGGMRLTRGEGTGPTTGPRIFSASTAWVPLPEAGLFGKVAVPIVGRFWLSVDLAAAAPLGRATFVIQGISSVSTPYVDFVATLNAGLQLL